MFRPNKLPCPIDRPNWREPAVHRRISAIDLCEWKMRAMNRPVGDQWPAVVWVDSPFDSKKWELNRDTKNKLIIGLGPVKVCKIKLLKNLPAQMKDYGRTHKWSARSPQNWPHPPLRRCPSVNTAGQPVWWNAAKWGSVWPWHPHRMWCFFGRCSHRWAALSILWTPELECHHGQRILLKIILLKILVIFQPFSKSRFQKNRWSGQSVESRLALLCKFRVMSKFWAK